MTSEAFERAKAIEKQITELKKVLKPSENVISEEGSFNYTLKEEIKKLQKEFDNL